MRNEPTNRKLHRIPYCLAIEDSFARFHSLQKRPAGSQAPFAGCRVGTSDAQEDPGQFCPHCGQARKANRKFNTVPTI